MTPEEIQKLAAELYKQLVVFSNQGNLSGMSNPWIVGALSLIGTLVLTVAFWTSKSFFQQLGESLATKKDIKEIVEENKKVTEAVERIKGEVEQELDLEKEALQTLSVHRRIQGPVLKEAVRIVVRIVEVFEGKFANEFDRDWNPEQLIGQNLEDNKRDTTVYRIFRFLAAIEAYRYHSNSANAHPAQGFFEFYLRDKLEPILASGGYPGPSVIWRDAMIEVGEEMIEQSEKWTELRPIRWVHFSQLLNESESASFLNTYAESFSELFRRPNVRLALLGVYLIDLVQDNKAAFQKIDIPPRFEKERNKILKYIGEAGDTVEGQSFTIYGWIDGDEDWRKISQGVTPRNNRSPYSSVS